MERLLRDLLMPTDWARFTLVGQVAAEVILAPGGNSDFAPNPFPTDPSRITPPTWLRRVEALPRFRPMPPWPV
jgi:hypothetical protein